MKVAFYDLETANDPSKVGWRNYAAIQIACIGVVSTEYSPLSSWSSQIETRIFENATEAAKFLDDHDLVVGFNSRRFDNHVILQHVRKDCEFPFKTLDLLENLELRTGIKFVTGLDALASLTINEGKLEGVSGENAFELWSKDPSLVKTYCIQDCRITYKVFQFGTTYGYVLVPPNNKNPKLFGNLALRVEVDWKEYLAERREDHGHQSDQTMAQSSKVHLAQGDSSNVGQGGHG